MWNLTRLAVAAGSQSTRETADQVTQKIADAIPHAMAEGLMFALRLVWPYMLPLLILALATAYMKGKVRRKERDREYRRMARTVWDEKPGGAGDHRRLVMCPDCRRESVASYAPQPGVPAYCDECYQRRLRA